MRKWASKVTLNPVGHQSTNCTAFDDLIEAMAAFTSLGTTSPRYRRHIAMYLPVLGSHFTICGKQKICYHPVSEVSREVVNTTARKNPHTRFIRLNFLILYVCVFDPIISGMGGVKKGSLHMGYVPVISANVPCTYYVQPLKRLFRGCQ